MKSLLFYFLFAISAVVSAAQITISNNGVTSSSYWSISTVGGVTTIMVSSSASTTIDDSIIEQYLNSGNDVIIKMSIPAQGDQIIVTGNINKTAGGEATITLKADVISLNSSSSIVSTSGRLNVILWSEYPSAASGRTIITSSTINTNGGGLAIAGQTSTTTWSPYPGGTSITIPTGVPYGSNVPGLHISGSSINTSGGNIYARGRTINNTGNTTNVGLLVEGSTILTGVGNIDMYGAYGADSGIASYISGLEVNGSSITSTSGNIVCSGLLEASGNLNYGHALRLGTKGWSGNTAASGDVSITSESGNITLSGTMSATYATANANGLTLITAGTDDVTISSNTGNITINGTNNQTNGAQHNGLLLSAGGGAISVTTGGTGTTEGGTINVNAVGPSTGDDYGIYFSSTSTVGNIRIGDGNSGNVTLSFKRVRNPVSTTSGVAVIESYGDVLLQGDGSTSFGAALTLPDEFNFAGADAFQIGNSSNIQDITLATPIAVTGNVAIYGSELTLDAPVSSTGGSINFEVFTLNANVDFETDGNLSLGYLNVALGTVFKLNTGDEVEITGNLNNAGTLNIESGATFNQSSVTGNVVNSGTINIKHNASFVQKYSGNDANTNSGTYNVIRTKEFEDQTRYSFWSSPVTGETAEDVFWSGDDTNPSDWIRWDYTQGTNQGGQWDFFFNPMSPTTLLPGIGYGFTPTQQPSPTPNNITDTRTFSSSTINNGTINIDVSNASGGDYVLVGNPYPSNISISNFLSLSNTNASVIENAVYIWSDHALDFNDDGGYFVIDRDGTMSSPSFQNYSPSASTIAPMQGFFVQLVSSPSGSINFNNSQRATGNSTFLKTDPAEYAWLSLAHESGTGNQVVVGLKDQAVAGYAQGEDSPCLKMSATMEFYVTDPAKDLTIEYRPKPVQSVDYVPLGLDAWATGTYTFALDSTRNWDAAVPVMVLDSMLGQMVDLHQTDYTFNVNFAGPIRDRFYLVLDGATVGEEELTPEADSWYWYQANNQLHIEGAKAERITLRNIQGQMVAQTNQKQSLSLTGVAQGVYTLDVQTHRGTTMKKVVIKN